MELKDIFFKSFFYPFLVGIFLSTLVITLTLGIFTNNYYDKRTRKNIIDLEKKYSEIMIKSINTMITTFISRLQISLNEQIVSYKKIANDLLEDENSHTLQSDYFVSAVTAEEDFCDEYYFDTEFMGVWIYDKYTTNENLDDSKKDLKLQLTAYSNIISNLDSILEVTWRDASPYFFYFEKTELYIAYPLSYHCDKSWLDDISNYSEKYENTTCMDENGEHYKIYKMKCEGFFINMIKSRTMIFDNNYLSSQHKTIFINNFYFDRKYDEYYEFTLCIEFDDPITEGKGYACTFSSYYHLALSLDNLNSDMKGYFFVSNIGYNNVIFFPLSSGKTKTSTQFIFDWNFDFYLEEKVKFYYQIKNFFSSNYIDNLRESLDDEIYINGKNSSEQYFYVNGKKFNYSIYPVMVENTSGQKEHILSIIYVYNNSIYIEGLKTYESSMALKIILELILIIIFGSGLLYIIYLTFNTLSKYITIPIKNVNYMLKGINIGGKHRLKYLDFLRKKQDESLEKLEQIYFFENKNNTNKNEFAEDSDNQMINNYEKNNDNFISGENINNLNSDHINSYSHYNKKYDEESNFIEKEYSFYDFDEQLLQYRPLEINRLVKSLMDLKGSMLLTSDDREVNEIIDYSYSEEIFRNFKNKEGEIICQSNIGNLQSQLLKYDKAIYHLVLSLQNNKLKRFLSKNLSDELDESDFLLNTIYGHFNKEKKVEKVNILAEKQKNSKKDDFSQKEIGILIKTRYCRLIYVYYKFFKNLKKINKLNNDIIKGQFMNTLFHTVNYYHKILIQFIFLSYVKNDLVKLGESILDYIEFLIKFKFKTSSDEKYLLNYNYREQPEYKKKQNIKKKIFDKIIKWFNLFDEYISYVKDNTTLFEEKSILDDYTKSLNTENNEFNFENQSALMFKINIQKYDFLKGKFSLYCKNYNDALFYFIRSAKKKSIVIDGLIQKRSLKNIYKILLIIKEKIADFKLKNLYMEKEMKEYSKNKNKFYDKKLKMFKKYSNRSLKGKDLNAETFGKKIEDIKSKILENINKFEIKKEKDILILIDFNLYSNHEDNLYIKTYRIDAFIDETISIVNNYLSGYDRLSVFIYTSEYHIICPLMYVKEIDKNSFSKDLINYKNATFKEKGETEEYDINFNDFKDKDFELNLEGENINDYSHEESSEICDNEGKNFSNISGLIMSINFLNKYLKMKEEIENEKYIILFSDMLNMMFIHEETIKKIKVDLNENKDAIFLLVGKTEKIDFKRDNYNYDDSKNYQKLEEIILNKFGEKSDIINLESMKKIKSILSNTNVIKDNIIYPNEIYK